MSTYQRTIIETITAVEWRGGNINEILNNIGSLGLYDENGVLLFKGIERPVGVFVIRRADGVIDIKSPDEMLEYKRVK